MTAGEFWAWFEANESRFRDAEVGRNDGGAFDELLAKLRAYNEKLGYGVSPPREDGRSLVISADGCELHFPSVDALVAAAPAIPHWRFLALKPGAGFGISVRFDGAELVPARMTFDTVEDVDGQGRLGLRLFIPGLPEERAIDAVQAAWQLLETALGERTCWSELGSVDIVPEPDASAEWQDHLPLTNLPTFLDWRRRGRRVEA